MTYDNWRVVVPNTFILGEGPVWDNNEKILYWVDIVNGEIHSFSPMTGEHNFKRMGQMVGAVAVNSTGGLVVALEDGIALIDFENEEQEILASPEANLLNNRFNDGKCDPAGRFWAGTMSISGEIGAGSLYVLNNDHSVSVKIEHVSCSNGLAWSLDHRTFYFIDTPTREVVAYDYDVMTASITNKRVVIETSVSYGYPDGMTIDSEGMLWIAFFDGWRVSRFNPNTGEVLLSILLPVAKVTSCTFGGETLEDLYITSAKEGLNTNDLKDQPLAGSLFIIEKCGFRGVSAQEFIQKSGV